jgi:hypothetical protein
MSLALLLASFQASGQRKSKVDPRDAQIDSLTKFSKNLTMQLDSVSIELVKYLGVYNAIREKVIPYDFDPTRSAYLIDSLKASRDSASILLSSSGISTVSSDSIMILLKENTLQKASIDSLKVALERYKTTYSMEELEKAKAVSSLKQLKELLDAKIISDTEFISLKNKYLNKL